MWRSRQLLGFLAAALSGACTSEVAWAPVPPTSSPTAIVTILSRSSVSAFALDLRAPEPLRLDAVEEDTSIEAALFDEPLETLGLAAGPTEPSMLERPLRPSDGHEFMKLTLEVDEPRWLRTSAMSELAAALALPVPRPEEPCPSFERELVLLHEPGLVYSMVRGEGDSVLVFGQEVLSLEGDRIVPGDPRVFEVHVDGSVVPLETSPRVVIESAVIEDGRGYWAGIDGQMYWGVKQGARIELEAIGPPVLPGIFRFVGSPTSSTSLHALTDDVPTPGVVSPAVHRFDGRTWVLLAALPSDATENIARGDEEVVVVSNGEPDALHFTGEGMIRRALPDVAVLVRHVPGYGLIAGERGAFMRYSKAERRWDVLTRPADRTTRVRDIGAYRRGFVAVYETAVAFYSPTLGAFCPIVDIPWSDLTWVEAVGEDLVIAPVSDRESASLRVYILRHRGGGF